MAKAETIILVGNPGLGKTHLALGLGLAACQQGKRVRFYTAAALVNDLLLAAKELRSSRFLAQFHRLDVLILGELGFIPFFPRRRASLIPTLLRAARTGLHGGDDQPAFW
jgi:DNA replication protein DnaC